MTPGWTSYRKHLLYQTYDVKKFIKRRNQCCRSHAWTGMVTKAPVGLTKSRNKLRGPDRICHADPHSI